MYRYYVQLTNVPDAILVNADANPELLGGRGGYYWVFKRGNNEISRFGHGYVMGWWCNTGATDGPAAGRKEPEGHLRGGERQRRLAAEMSSTFRDKLRMFCYVVAPIIGALALGVVLQTAFTEPGEVTKIVGWAAAMLALSAAGVGVAQAAYSRTATDWRWSGIFLGIIAIGSAYMWAAEATETNPASLGHLLNVGAYVIVSAVLALAVTITYFSVGRSRYKPPSDN